MFRGNISNFALLGCNFITILPLLIADPLHESIDSCIEDTTSTRQDVFDYTQGVASTEVISDPLSKRFMLHSGDTSAYTSFMNYVAGGAIATCSAIAFSIARIQIQGWTYSVNKLPLTNVLYQSEILLPRKGTKE